MKNNDDIRKIKVTNNIILMMDIRIEVMGKYPLFT